MKKITSFCVDHRKLNCGIYVSRIDGNVVTYDLRVKKPNTGDLMTNLQMHTAEHMFATFVRNSKIADNVVYFGPMGCQTGFYLLVTNDISRSEVLNTVKDVLKNILEYDGPVFGASEIECGNFRSLDLTAAKQVCAEYAAILEPISQIPTYDDVK